jgi:hypothetical protein
MGPPSLIPAASVVADFKPREWPASGMYYCLRKRCEYPRKKNDPVMTPKFKMTHGIGKQIIRKKVKKRESGH